MRKDTKNSKFFCVTFFYSGDRYTLCYFIMLKTFLIRNGNEWVEFLEVIGLEIELSCSTWPVDDPSKVQKGSASALLPAASTFFLSRVLVFERVLPAASILRSHRNIGSVGN
jgi:hypothetical protein